MAGLVCYYNTGHYHYLHIVGDDVGNDAGRKFITVTSCDNFITSQPTEQIDITGVERVFLKADFNGAALQFYFAVQEGEWQSAGPVLDGSILSDDYVGNKAGRFHACFTGAFYGLCCQDLSGRRLAADFACFEYREI